MLEPTSVQSIPTVSMSSLRVVDQVADLTALFESNVSVVTLRRLPSLELVTEARRAASERRMWLFSVRANEATRLVPNKLEGFPLLAADVAFWVEVLAELTGFHSVGVRLAHVETAMCPRFHVDKVTLRVVNTYLGNGTEYVPNEVVDRSRLGHAALGKPDEASGLLREPGLVRTARPFDVVFLKGEMWHENHGRGAVHRSPVASPESPRLVLTLDPLD